MVAYIRINSKITLKRWFRICLLPIFLRRRKPLKNFFIKNSLKNKLISVFIITAIIPLLFIIVSAYYNSSQMIKDNLDELNNLNLQKTQNSLDIWMESYSDILYQVYTDDDIVALVDKINNNIDIAVSRNQLRRTLRGLFYTKEYLKSITIITDNGTVVFYDQLTASDLVTSWIDNYPLSQDELYDRISSDNQTHILSTQLAKTVASDTYYLFHIAHRVIDYKNLMKKSGVVIISIDETMLKHACTSVEEENETVDNFSFIVDQQGHLVSYTQDEQLSKQITPTGLGEEGRKQAYLKFLKEEEIVKGNDTSIYLSYDDKLKWDIVSVTDQSDIVEKLKTQQRLLITTLLLSLMIIVTMIFILTGRLTHSIEKVVEAMKRAGKGQLSVRAEVGKNFPVEIETIVVQFNHMLEKVETSVTNEKQANVKQRDAEIKALEAQINPHFLYNTLDTINWIAIDHHEYEISNAINSLAAILRYGIDRSNGIVTIRDEVEWLKQYIYLQQTRLKNTFQCDMHVEPGVLEQKIHKLLLQPFVENAIIHGFEGVGRKHQLVVEIKEQDEFILISLVDNGKGIEKKLVEDINKSIFKKTEDKNHIGMENAITRIKMYYGETAEVIVQSVLGEGTDILIKIPRKE
ncbi:MAG: yehU 12 [Clostridiales bacterium]|nr:yehU 12 [Clostridiales bacterium]